MMKVEWICTGRTNERSFFNYCYENSFRNLSEEFIINIDLLTLRTRSKSLGLSMCNRIMCFKFHTQNISVS